jgi:hypothetical protein
MLARGMVDFRPIVCKARGENAQEVTDQNEWRIEPWTWRQENWVA